MCLERFGGSKVDLETYRETIQIPVIDSYCLHGCSREQIENNNEEASAIFFERYKQLSDSTLLRPKTEHLLRWLGEHSVECIILSNHSPEGIEYHLDRFGISEYFSEVSADIGDSSLMKQSKGERLKRYFASKNISPKEAINIGDTAEEVNIGKEIGMSTVSITGGYFSRPRLQAANPDFLIDTFDEFQKIIQPKVL